MNVKEKQEEFLNLLEPVHSRLSGYARAMTRNREQSRDLVAETILVAYEKFDSLKNKSAFSGFVFTIATRLHKRWIWRRRLFGNYNEEEAEQIPAK